MGRVAVLLRSAPAGADPYAQAISCALPGLRVENVPALSIGICQTARRDIRNILCTASEQRKALILTSSNAADAVASALEEAERCELRSLPVYTVGASTAARIAQTLPTAEIRGKTSGSASALASIVAADWESGYLSRDTALYFLSGTSRRDELPRALTASGIPLHEIQVYQSNARPPVDVAAEADEVCGSDDLAAVGVFSPAGVPAAAAIRYRRAPRAIPMIAIGKTSSAAISDIIPDATAFVAAKPDATAFTDALSRALEQE